MIIRDFICRKCGIEHKDVLLKNAEEKAFCPICMEEMDILYTKMRFNKRFADSHDNEYNKYGRRIK